MEGFNEDAKKAAVATYSPLHKEGKNEAEIKGAITEDANGFTPDQVAEIYQAIASEAPADKSSSNHGTTNTQTPEEKPKVKKGGFVVLQEFRDKDNFDKVFEKGDDVSKLDAVRLENLVKLKIVEKVK